MGSTVGADNAWIGSEIDADGTSNSPTSIEAAAGAWIEAAAQSGIEAAARLFLDGRKGPVSDAVLFLAAY